MAKNEKTEILQEGLGSDLIAAFTNAEADDDEGWDKKGDRLILTYRRADEKTRDLIDDIFITLCGWSFKTLLNRAQGESSRTAKKTIRAHLATARGKHNLMEAVCPYCKHTNYAEDGHLEPVQTDTCTHLLEVSSNAFVFSKKVQN